MSCVSLFLLAELFDILVDDGIQDNVALLLARADGSQGIVGLDLLVNLECLVVLLLVFQNETGLEEVFCAQCGHVGCLGSLLEGIYGLVELLVRSVAVGEGEEGLSRDGGIALDAEVFEILDGFLRLAELVAIDIDHFSDDYRSLRVKGKGDKERQLPIVERLRVEIIRYVERFSAEKICINQEKALFLSKQGGRILRGEVQRSVARLLRECGVQGKRSPHVLRHTFATHLLNDGADLREIQELLGHSSLRATQIYTHSNIAQLQRIYEVAHPRSGGAASADVVQSLGDSQP